MNECDDQILRKRLLLKGELLTPLPPGNITAPPAPDPLPELGLPVPPELLVSPLDPGPPLPLLGLLKLTCSAKVIGWHTCQSNK